jgi:hypothetical protein
MLRRSGDRLRQPAPGAEAGGRLARLLAHTRREPGHDPSDGRAAHLPPLERRLRARALPSLTALVQTILAAVGFTDIDIAAQDMPAGGNAEDTVQLAHQDGPGPDAARAPQAQPAVVGAMT